MAHSAGAFTAVLILGAVHGINPAMGWLFAVALGLQEERRGAVLRTLGPLAIGHALSIASVLIIAASIGLVIATDTLKWLMAVMLLVMGAVLLRRHYHPRAGMRVGVRDLTVWSFLVATAHGAGLMAVPFVLTRNGAQSMHTHAHGAHHGLLLAGLPHAEMIALAATVVHTVGYLLVTGAVALVVYEKVGLQLLQRAWININLLWALALIATALLTPFI